MKRDDDFATRREHLAQMDDEQLKTTFWKLAEQVVDPLLKLGYENTSPSIERSILLRMGFSSIEAKPIVEGALANNLLGHGAGNVVYRLSKDKNISIREAGLALADDKYWDDAVALFKS
ncbi:ornithine aminomutase subunit alpha [Clostridia bacterium OttesenSCG-928-O13]|nr:ornithine aminomutase subunit alpha [Clostridia bacterium OttesenSCG-928-O13]